MAGKREERLLRTHIVQGEDCRDVELFEFQEFITIRHRGGSEELPGMKRLATAEGWSVNVMGDGCYEVAQTEERLTSDAYDAPGKEG